MNTDKNKNNPKSSLIKKAMDSLADVDLFADKIKASKKVLRNIKKLPKVSR